ncbi:MAG: S8 family serine peptidase [Desulfurococcaceae archaeon]
MSGTRKILALALGILFVALSIVPPSASTSTAPGPCSNVDELLSAFDAAQPGVADASLPGMNVVGAPTPEPRAGFLLVVDRIAAASLSREFKLKYYVPLPSGVGVAYALLTKEELKSLACAPGVRAVMPSPPLSELIEPARPPDQELAGAAPVETQQATLGYRTFSSLDVLGVRQAWASYGVMGNGTIVGIVDTGVDFTTPELGPDAIARDSSGTPLLVVNDEHLALTPITVVRDSNGYLNTSGAVVPVFSTLYSGIYGYPYVYTVRVTVNYTAPPVSLSGIYKFGFLEWFFYDSLTGYLVRVLVPTLLVDPFVPGLYNAAMFDLSTAFYTLSITMRSLENRTLGRIYWVAPNPSWLDYSFNDEQLFVWGSNDVVGRDFDGDGIIDFGLGAIAGTYIDSYGLANYTWTGSMLIPGTPGQYPGLDPNGNYIAIFTDWHGHGTSVATIIAARGRLNYTGYGDGVYKLYGVAPGAKLSAGTGFFFGDLIPVEYWLGGWDWVYDPSIGALVPVPSGIRRADVISNSWAYINLAKWGHQGPGVDVLSATFDQIIAVNLLIGHNVTIVFAAGNYGPGYTTISSPGADMLIIEVAASTNFEYFRIYGYPPGYASDIIPFSSRGPNAAGYPKPDVAAVGAFEWAGVRTIEGRGRGATWYNEGAGGGLTLFGGTSEATPFTSGVLALAVQAYRAKYGVTPSPIELKVLLKSTAGDLGYPSFEQGSGLINAYRLVTNVLAGGFRAYLEDPVRSAFLAYYSNVYGEFTGMIASYLADTALYAVVAPGTSAKFAIKVEGYGPVMARAVAYAATSEIVVYNGTYAFGTSLFTLSRQYFYDASYLEIYILFQNLSYRYPYFGRMPPSDLYMIRADLFDYYNGKLYRITTDARTSTEAVLAVGNPGKLRGDLVIRLRPNPAGVPPTPVSVAIVARIYKAVPFAYVSLPTTATFVNGTATIVGTISVPSIAKPGIYDFKIHVFTPRGTIVIPCSLLVPVVLDSTYYAKQGVYRSMLSYDSYTPLGLASPGTYRYTEASDWRLVPVLVTDPTVSGFVMYARWNSGVSTSLDVLVQPPGGSLLPTGDLNYFASYKLTASLGYVYNPSIPDQLAGMLRLFVPVKWPLPLSNIVVNTHYSVSIGATGVSESVLQLYTTRVKFLPGLYMVMLSYSSFSGSMMYDTVTLEFAVVRAYQTVSTSATGFTVTATFVAAVMARPILGSLVYTYTDGSYQTAGSLPIYVRVFPNGTSITYSITAGYIGRCTTDWMYTVTYSVTGATYVETLLQLPGSFWHASGLYYYNATGGNLVIVSIAYPGLATAGAYP